MPAAPENILTAPASRQVLRDLRWTRAGDVYSFAVLAYEVAAGGEQPYHALPNERIVMLFAAASADLPALLYGPLLATLPPRLCGAMARGAGRPPPPLTPGQGRVGAPRHGP
jgi:hypothetical protein